MDDPWSSVESMLRWQIAQAKSFISEKTEKLPKVGEIYPLPKSKPGEPTQGRPDQWAFGKLTPHEVSLAGAMSGLQWASHKINKAEEALFRDDLPTAICWIIAANQSIQSALALWNTGGAIAMWRYVGKYRAGQAIKAGNKRTTIDLDGQRSSISKLVAYLAAKQDVLGDDLPHKVLWSELIGILAGKGCSPVETAINGDILLKFISGYDDNDASIYTNVKFSSFKTMVGKARKK